MLEDTNPDAAFMYLVHKKCVYEESKEIQKGSPTHTFLVGKYGLRRTERWEGMPSMSSEVGEI